MCMWLCRSGEFQYQAERVLENTLSNIMREAQRGEFLVTARPRLIALPPRQLQLLVPAVSAPSLPASISATRVSADTLAAATAASRAPTRAVPAAAAPSAAAAAANPTATANRESRAHRDAHVTSLAT